MFAEFPGQSRATCDLIEKTANRLNTTDIPDSLINGTHSLYVFLGGEMINHGTYSGGFTVKLAKSTHFEPGEIRRVKVGTRYQRIDFFTSGHVPIYETYQSSGTTTLLGYEFTMYENQKLNSPSVVGNIPKGFRWSNGYHEHRIKALLNEAPVFHVTVPIGGTNALTIGNLFERIYSKIQTREMEVLARKDSEEKRIKDEAAEKLRLEALERVNRALNLFEEEASQSRY